MLPAWTACRWRIVPVNSTIGRYAAVGRRVGPGAVTSGNTDGVRPDWPAFQWRAAPHGRWQTSRQERGSGYRKRGGKETWLFRAFGRRDVSRNLPGVRPRSRVADL